MIDLEAIKGHKVWARREENWSEGRKLQEVLRRLSGLGRCPGPQM